MTYQVLARKWRPQLFEEIVGQHHVTRTLKNALSLGKIAHAYLFAGPRGTGKTSTARIMAKALNCEKGITPSPCNQCSSCVEIASGESLDVLEIDGASNRGIDEVRELREQVNFSPIKGRFKVYIIDEVHMLTHPAFNALLKTLEEPPSHVVFIFATTEPEKVPPTILSRCQRFDFRKIGLKDIVSRLSQIAEKEKIRVSLPALRLIAEASENSMRDAEKILDQLTSYSPQGIKEDDVIGLMGMVETDYLIKMTENLYCHDALSNIKLIHELLDKGKSPRWILRGWLNWLRDLLMFKMGETEEFLFGQLQKDEVEIKKIIQQQSSFFTVNQLVDMMQSLSQAEEKIHYSPNPQIYLEVLIIRLSIEENEPQEKLTDPQLSTVYHKIVSLEEKIKKQLDFIREDRKKDAEELPEKKKESFSFPEIRKEAQIKSLQESKQKLEPASKAPESFPAESIQNLAEEGPEKWKKVVLQIKEKKKTLGSFLEKMHILSIEDGKIVLGSEKTFHKEILENRENQKIILEELKKFFPEKFSLKFKRISGRKKPEKKSSPSLRETVARAIEIFDGEVVNVTTRR